MEYFALAEELTGVRLTPESLEQAVFSAGIVALTAEARAQGWSWTDPDPTPDEPAARASDIRSWAESRGIRVTDRGAIPLNVVEAHDASHLALPRDRERPAEG